MVATSPDHTVWPPAVHWHRDASWVRWPYRPCRIHDSASRRTTASTLDRAGVHVSMKTSDLLAAVAMKKKGRYITGLFMLST